MYKARSRVLRVTGVGARWGAVPVLHGITDEEIIQGPVFPEVWSRFLHWVDALLNYAIVEESDSDSDVENSSLPQIHDHPVLLLAGHNRNCFQI